jgi:GTP-binding protein HflX
MAPLNSPSEAARESAIVVGIHQPPASAREVADGLDELEQLVASAGVRVIERVIFRRREAHPGLLIGRGQAEDLARRAAAGGATTLIFDDDLTPAQGRNLEQAAGARVVDRTQVILDIFAQRARSSEGRLQVELAQLEYLLPRLRHMWSHLERQKGGIGLKGPGEQQLELDRRGIERKIHRIRQDLEQVRARREEQRRGRARHGWAPIVLVGYTNAGKSTLLNALCAARVATDDRLFATLDPTTRRLELPDHQPALLTDTVGFIRKLPHRLVEAFKATLEEVTEADLLIHVVDASHPGADEQIAAVRGVLAELGAAGKPCLHALNKIDRPGGARAAARLAGDLPDSVAVSARTGEGLDALRAAVADRLRSRYVSLRLLVPAAEGRILALLRENGNVQSESCEEDRMDLRVRVPPWMVARLAPFAVKEE